MANWNSNVPFVSKTLKKKANAAESVIRVPSRSVMVRSLRRRLWKALQEDDVETAMRAYTATKSDYERWLDEELFGRVSSGPGLVDCSTKVQMVKEHRDCHSPTLTRSNSSRNKFIPKRLVSFNQSKRNLTLASRNLASAELRKLHLLDDSVDRLFPPQPVLQTLFHPSEELSRDDFYGPYARYDIGLLSPKTNDATQESSMKSKGKVMRLAAGFVPWKSQRKLDCDTSFQVENLPGFKEKKDENMTTLLHEACRLANPDFVRLLLEKGGNPNVRNGALRTSLHMVAGGACEGERQHLKAAEVGILKPETNLDENDKEGSHGYKLHDIAARTMTRLFLNSNDETAGTEHNPIDPISSECSADHYTSYRMDALLAILSWSHPDDGSPASGEGSTINSVDIRGRSALHYAAELGRMELCLAILNSFGAILTIVDDAGQTPAELAAEQHHVSLAAYLEARSLLYTDPFDFGEDLLANSWANQSEGEAITTSASETEKESPKKKKRTAHSKLAPPYCWFETWTMEKVRLERQDRVAKIWGRMTEILVSKQEIRDSLEFMFNHGIKDSSEEEALSSELLPKGDSLKSVSNEFKRPTLSSVSFDVVGNSIDDKASRSDNRLFPSELDHYFDRNTPKDEASTNESGITSAAVNGQDTNAMESDGLANLTVKLSSTSGIPAVIGMENHKEEIRPVATELANFLNRSKRQDDASTIGSGITSDAVHGEVDTKVMGSDGSEVDTLSIREPAEDQGPRSASFIRPPVCIENVMKSSRLPASGLVDNSVRNLFEEMSISGSADTVASDEVNRKTSLPLLGEIDAIGVDKLTESIAGENVTGPVSVSNVPRKTADGELLLVANKDEEKHTLPSSFQLGTCFGVDDDTTEVAIAGLTTKTEDCNGAQPPKEIEVLLKRLHPTVVEKFSAFHLWNKNDALKAFKSDPIQALKSAGIELPLDTDMNGRGRFDDPNTVQICLICCDEFDVASNAWIKLSCCEHAFCSECLGNYVSECAKSKERGIVIKCPHHECPALLSFDEIQELAPTSDVHESLQKVSDEIFVATAEDLCFCPHPGCDLIVRRLVPSFARSAKLNHNLINLSGAVCAGHVSSERVLTYDGVPDDNYQMTINAVQPKKPHRFCFSCGSQSIHWPIDCDLLEQWNEKIEHELGEVEGGEPVDGSSFNEIAQKMWMKANTRPCPKCKAPIEKNDGCNHMTCSNRSCRHEFCWICREDWRLHNTETGGFFRCNRWQAEDPTSALTEERALTEPSNSDASVNDAVYGTALHSSREAWKKKQDMGLFLHNYDRWTAHAESAALERQMADTVCDRLLHVVEAAIDFDGQYDFDFGGMGLSFIHAAFSELLECRSLLQHSYAFTFYRYPIQYHVRRDRVTKRKEREKLNFEQLQSELEMLTEQMSDIVARKHLRATQMQIMFLTKNACQKRSEITSFMLKLLNEQQKEESEREAQEKSLPSVGGSLMFDLTNPEFTRRHQRPRIEHPRAFYRPRRGIDEDRRNLLDDFDDRDFSHFFLPTRTIARPVSARRIDAMMHDPFRDHIPSFVQFGSDEIRQLGRVGQPRFLDWACTECTYMNAGGRHCAMCGTMRGQVVAT